MLTVVGWRRAVSKFGNVKGLASSLLNFFLCCLLYVSFLRCLGFFCSLSYPRVKYSTRNLKALGNVHDCDLDPGVPGPVSPFLRFSHLGYEIDIIYTLQYYNNLIRC